MIQVVGRVLNITPNSYTGSDGNVRESKNITLYHEGDREVQNVEVPANALIEIDEVLELPVDLRKGVTKSGKSAYLILNLNLHQFKELYPDRLVDNSQE